MTKRTLFLIFLVSLAISFLLYGNTIKGAFVYDDSFFAARSDLRQVTHLPKLWLEPSTGHASNGAYRPLAMFSFALNFIVFGESPASFHVINIILNAVAVFLVFLLVFKLFHKKTLAVFSAFFYAFLPIHTEAVASIKSRDEILASIFILLAWFLFAKSVEADGKLGWRSLFGSSFLFILGILSKETFILSPLLFLAVWQIQNKPNLKRIAKATAAFLPASLAYLGARYAALGNYAFGASDDDFVTNPLLRANLWQHIWTPFKVAFIYIAKTFVPYNLSATYHLNHVPLVSNPLHSIQALMGIAFLASLILFIWSKNIRITPIGVGAVIFLVPYIMVSKFFFQAADIAAERWLYFPSLGLSLISGYVFDMVRDFRKRMGVVIILVILAFYGTIVVSRNRVWLSSEALFNSMIQNAPDSVQGYVELVILRIHHHPIKELYGLIDKAHEIAPDYGPALAFKGISETDKGNFQAAEQLLLKARAAEANPLARYVGDDLEWLYYTSAMAYAQSGNFDKALGQATKLQNLTPGSWKNYLLLGQIYFIKKDYPQSVYYYQKAFDLNPGNAMIKSILSSLKEKTASVTKTNSP